METSYFESICVHSTQDVKIIHLNLIFYVLPGDVGTCRASCAEGLATHT